MNNLSDLLKKFERTYIRSKDVQKNTDAPIEPVAPVNPNQGLTKKEYLK